ncbi:hypothetical protein [Chitinimonas sp. BJYL2]|uniref:hypothetical protein n=1 Tax=Chitinimonas sp. BJYL2 TaxID=2976696 RepID=UPI0022B3951B|nr:hypothetical protein [Chitinimonas sp. BJYL2]
MVHNLISRWWRLALLIPFLVLAACNSSGTKDKPEQAPQNFTVTPGDGQVTITWTDDPALTYWVFGAAATTVTPDTYATFPEARVLWPVRSPLVVSGLTNGKTYAFTINATRSGSGAGPAATSISAIPRTAGNSWTNSTVGTADFNAVQFNPYTSTFLSVGNGGAAYTSTDGSNWTARTTGVSADLVGLFFDNVQFLALASDGKVLTSSDAATWTAKTATWDAGFTTQPRPRIRHLVSAAGALVYFAVGENGTLVSAIPDLSAWVVENTGTTRNLNRGYFNSTIGFIVVGDGGTILTSPVPTSTTAQATRVWTQRNSGTTEDLHGIYQATVTQKDATTGAETAVVNYFVVGKKGTILRSTDLVTWTADVSNTTQDLYALSGYSQLLAVGANGTVVIRGTDGKWMPASTGNAAQLGDLVVGGARFVAVGKAGAISTAY